MTRFRIYIPEWTFMIDVLEMPLSWTRISVEINSQAFRIALRGTSQLDSPCQRSLQLPGQWTSHPPMTLGF